MPEVRVITTHIFLDGGGSGMLMGCKPVMASPSGRGSTAIPIPRWHICACTARLVLVNTRRD